MSYPHLRTSLDRLYRPKVISFVGKLKIRIIKSISSVSQSCPWHVHPYHCLESYV